MEVRILTPEQNIEFNFDTISKDTIPAVLVTLLLWGCHKNDNETFEEYINRTGRVCNKNWIKKCIKSRTLQQTTADGYDTTLLYQLIPAVCDNILPAGTPEWEVKVKDKSCVEYLLRKVKDIRDIKAHHDKAKLKNIDLRKDVENPLCQLLQAAGELYSKSQTEIDDEISKVKDMISKLDESAVDYIRNSFAEEGKEELKNYWIANRTKVNLPSATPFELTRHKVFNTNIISCAEGENGKQNTKRSFPSNRLLDEVNSRCIVLQGDPGFGKSTLLKMIVDDWVGINSARENFLKSTEFDMLVFVDCFQNMHESFMQFLKSLYPKTLAFINLPDDVLEESLSHLRILFIVDGYDECSAKSRKCVHRMIETTKTHTNRTCLISSRPFGGADLMSHLKKCDISFKAATIEPINSLQDQEVFLEKYQSEMDPKASFELVQTFKSLPVIVRQVFISPLLLVMFCSMYQGDKSLVSEWKSEWHIFTSFHNHILTMMKLRAEDVVNSDIIVESIMEKISKLSLQLLLQSSNVLTEKAYVKFCKECFEKLSRDIPYDSVLSCVLNMRISIGTLEKSWRFFHTSLQEYLAARYIVNELDNLEVAKQDKNVIELITKKSPGYRGPESLLR